MKRTEVVVEREDTSSTRFDAVSEYGNEGSLVRTGDAGMRVEDGESGVETAELLVAIRARGGYLSRKFFFLRLRFI
jgi:hypothetical protein